ncbi:MAG: Mur ligase family protein, partial [Cyclonatronaceae bacterium]
MAYLFFVELLVLFFFAAVLRHSYTRGLLFLHQFQQKGYKPNEYSQHIFGQQLAAFVSKAHLFVVPLFLLGLADEWLTETAFTLLVSIFGFVFFLPVGYMNREKPKKPLVFTPRLNRQLAVLIVLYMALAGAGIYIGMQLRVLLPDITIMALFWLLADMLMPLLVLLAGFITRPVERRIQEGFKRQARQKIARMPDLKIIAITGSYGKTSVKFILKTILEERFSVCYTPGSFNTPMGICKVINNDLQSHHQILILEMGARYKGNIAELCRIATPDVSVVTIVGKAHLETFGSVENIAKTKGEILQGLREGGTAVLNSDDERVMNMPLREDVSVIKAGLKTGIFELSEVGYDHEGSRFQVSTPEGETAEIRTRLLGGHSVQNLLFGLAVGRHFGLRLSTMALAATRIEPVEHRLELKPAGDITIIDDAFNSNPVGARNAVDVLARFDSGRRIIITPGMVELGAEEEAENRALGRHIGHSGIDAVFLVGPERTRPIQEGLREAGYPEAQIQVFSSFYEARDYLNTHKKPGDVVLLE